MSKTTNILGSPIRAVLARVIYDESQFLGGGQTGDARGWDQLLDWERDFYENLVDRLLQERELIKSWIQFSNDDGVARSAQAGE